MKRPLLVTALALSATTLSVACFLARGAQDPTTPGHQVEDRLDALRQTLRQGLTETEKRIDDVSQMLERVAARGVDNRAGEPGGVSAIRRALDGDGRSDLEDTLQRVVARAIGEEKATDARARLEAEERAREAAELRQRYGRHGGRIKRLAAALELDERQKEAIFELLTTYDEIRRETAANFDLTPLREGGPEQRRELLFSAKETFEAIQRDFDGDVGRYLDDAQKERYRKLASRTPLDLRELTALAARALRG